MTHYLMSDRATVRLGENDILNDTDCSVIAGVVVCAPPAVDVGVEETVSHPDFSMEGSNRLQNDIALVRLDRRVKFTGEAGQGRAGQGQLRPPGDKVSKWLCLCTMNNHEKFDPAVVGSNPSSRRMFSFLW